MSRTVYVIGGGPCGLALADELSQHHITTVVIEASASLGGLAQTFQWGSSFSDLGPHKLFSLNEELVLKVKHLLPENQWLTHPKISQIFLKGRYLPYPPSALSMAQTLGLWRTARAAWEWGLTQLPGQISPPDEFARRSFETDARGRLGSTLYSEFFQPLARKIWGDPATLDEHLSKSRIQAPSIRAMLGGLTKRKQKVSWQANTYFYPRGGIGVLWSTLAARIQARGGTLLLQDPLKELTVTGTPRRVERLVTVSGRSFSIGKEDWVISTIPLAQLAQLLNPEPLLETRNRISSLRLNDLWLVFLKVQEDVLQENAWIFVPDPAILFHRLSGQRKFDSAMVEPGIHLICCEVMHYAGKGTDHLSDQDLTSRCLSDLISMGRLKRTESVRDSRVIRLPQSYPVMTLGYQETLREVLRDVDDFENFRTIGRQGAYNYIGSLDAMDTGIGMARWLLSSTASRSTWAEERQRTSFYPILD